MYIVIKLFWVAKLPFLSVNYSFLACNYCSSLMVIKLCVFLIFFLLSLQEKGVAFF